MVREWTVDDVENTTNADLALSWLCKASEYTMLDDQLGGAREVCSIIMYDEII